MRLKVQQKLVLTEKKTKAVFFVVVSSLQNGIMELQIKGTVNVKYLRQTTLQVYDINRFCRYYAIYDFHAYVEELFTHKEITNKANHGRMSLEDLEHMMQSGNGYLMLRVQDYEKEEQLVESYDSKREKYLSLMHLALDLNQKSLFEYWGKLYEAIEKEAT